MATLNGSATDDGLPRGSVLETFWSFVSGPGGVPGCDDTERDGDLHGAGHVRAAADGVDGKLSASDELTIVVKPKPFTERTYTLDADFDQGNSFNVIHDVANQLQLDHGA